MLNFVTEYDLESVDAKNKNNIKSFYKSYKLRVEIFQKLVEAFVLKNDNL